MMAMKANQSACWLIEVTFVVIYENAEKTSCVVLLHQKGGG